MNRCVSSVESKIAQILTSPQGNSITLSHLPEGRPEVTMWTSLIVLGLAASTTAQTQYTGTAASEIAEARAAALTLSPTSNIVGKKFDRFVTIWCENTDFAMAAGDRSYLFFLPYASISFNLEFLIQLSKNTCELTVPANFAYLATLGITLSNYVAITHPSQPNYVAAVGGSTHGVRNDGFYRISASSKTIVDLLEARGVSWGVYGEDAPYSGFQANYVNQKNGKNDYVRKHK